MYANKKSLPTAANAKSLAITSKTTSGTAFHSTNIQQSVSGVNTNISNSNSNNSQNSLGSSKMEEEMQRLLDKYGAIPAGEKPARDVEFPKATDDGKVRRAYRTMAEAAGTPDEMVAPLQEQALSDTYVPIGDKQHINWSRI